jgi:tetratricopeptide (TPR) repeat protein
LKIPQIFDLNKELPEAASIEEQEAIKTLDEISKKISQVVSMDQEIPEEYSQYVLNLKDQVIASVRASVVLGHIFLTMKKFDAMKDLYFSLLKVHGESHVLLFYLALAQENSGDTQAALENYKKIIGSGLKNFHVYMQAAKIYHKEKQFSESTTMANLAIYENEHDSIEPFVLMAHNFYETNEPNRMFECFNRIEKIAGKDGLNSIGKIYDDHETVYKNVKSMLK